PAAASAARVLVRRGAERRPLVVGHDRRADDQQHDEEGGDDPRDDRQPGVDALEHQNSGGEPWVWGMNPSPLVGHRPTRIANSRPPAIGSAMPGMPLERTIVTFAAKVP